MSIPQEGTESKDTRGTTPANTSNLTENQDYKSLLSTDDYKFMTEAYEGSGGFKNAKYLVPHNAELKMYYDRRRDLSFYKNYVQPIIRATIDPVFNSVIKRLILVNGAEIKGGYYASAFLEDATGAGETLQEFTEDAETEAALHGVTFIVMDNASAEEQAAHKTKPEALAARVFPYVYLRTMDELVNSTQDKRGRLLTARFADAAVKVADSKGGQRVEERYTYYDNLVIRKERKDENGRIVTMAEVEHGLGRIPVIAHYYGSRKSQSQERIEIQPPFYDIARINCALFNKDSEIRAQERTQGFSVFYIQGDGGNATIGRYNLLWLPMDTTIPPGYAAPPADILRALKENAEALREDLFRIAGQKGVDFRGTQQRSGKALEWEFIAQEVVLKKTARRARLLELAIMDLLKAWTKEEYEYHADYPEKYGVEDEAGQIGELDDLLAMTMPAKVAAYIRKRAFMIKAKAWPVEETKPLLAAFNEPDDGDGEGGGEEEEAAGTGAPDGGPAAGAPGK